MMNMKLLAVVTPPYIYHNDCLEANQLIYDDRLTPPPPQNPFHNLPQTCGGIKFICLFWIRPTGNFLTYLITSFSINKL